MTLANEDLTLGDAAAVTPLTFRCTGCGNCCRSLRVAVTSFDVARLAAATSSSPHELVAWLAPDAVDMTGEPESFVELAEGRRLLVLAQRGGACQLLGADNLCGAYAARPRDCRAFPFDFVAQTRDPERRQLTLLPLSDCDYARDGQNQVALLEAEDRARWAELARYQALVARWNRQAWHRRRLHKRVHGAQQFLDFALAASPLARGATDASRTVNNDV
ncbi:MAG TPA: YkgJ family cysteine cluster protein [Polyangiaceae bacterium]|nr:YkgJ family cysteine cluster protein [Polyangiaceae bacterium]